MRSSSCLPYYKSPDNSEDGTVRQCGITYGALPVFRELRGSFFENRRIIWESNLYGG